MGYYYNVTKKKKKTRDVNGQITRGVNRRASFFSFIHPRTAIHHSSFIQQQQQQQQQQLLSTSTQPCREVAAIGNISRAMGRKRNQGKARKAARAKAKEEAKEAENNNHQTTTNANGASGCYRYCRNAGMVSLLFPMKIFACNS